MTVSTKVTSSDPDVLGVIELIARTFETEKVDEKLACPSKATIPNIGVVYPHGHGMSAGGDALLVTLRVPAPPVLACGAARS